MPYFCYIVTGVFWYLVDRSRLSQPDGAEVCTVFEKVRNLWKKIKAAVRKVVGTLRSVAWLRPRNTQQRGKLCFVALAPWNFSTGLVRLCHICWMFVVRKVEKHTITLSKCSHPSYPSPSEKDRALYHTVLYLRLRQLYLDTATHRHLCAVKCSNDLMAFSQMMDQRARVHFYRGESWEGIAWPPCW